MAIERVVKNKSKKNALLTKKEAEEYIKKLKVEPWSGDMWETKKGKEIIKMLEKETDKICRNQMNVDYVLETAKSNEVLGFIVSLKGEYLGFIFFTEDDSGNIKKLHLEAVCSAKSDKLKGIPLGQTLLLLLEEYAKKQGIDLLEAEALGGAIPFYKRTGWDIMEDDYNAGTTKIEKALSKKLKAKRKKEKALREKKRIMRKGKKVVLKKKRAKQKTTPTEIVFSYLNPLSYL